ncbi:MAG: polyprenyl synthetase family protein [Candidatus Marinimicrobia bacterium]|nr:polyprenyl synthetase family protein [Candidatus Neomarinimicrobiota bacterium]
MKEKLDILVANYRNEIDQSLKHLQIPEKPPGLYTPMVYSVTAPGKRIRPLLTFLTGEGLGVDHDRLRPAALAVEVLHAFTLVHDDIMDNDTQRRGLETVHVKWNTNTAILTGDGLMALACRLLMETDALRIRQMGFEFSQAMLEICEGQSLDVEFESRLDVTTESYLEMVGKKTGRLLGLSCQLGALISDADESVAGNLNQFGIELGQAFQIQDDLLEITSDARNMGKSLDSDIISGKKTYPLILIMDGLSINEKQSFLEFMKTNLDNRAAILDVFRRKNVFAETSEKITQLMNNALKRLDQLPSKTTENLQYLVDMISKRQR